MNDEDNAFADFNTAIKLDGKIAESWANQALVYERRGDKAKPRNPTPGRCGSTPTTSRPVDGLARTRRRRLTLSPDARVDPRSSTLLATNDCAR